jgi:Zn-dependent peptidase ImmA (M78 family)
MPKLAQALLVTTPQWLLGLKATPTFSLAYRLNGAAESAGAQVRAASVLNVEDLLADQGLVDAPVPTAAGQAVMEQIRTGFPAPPRSRQEAQRQGRRMAELVRETLNLGNAELGDLPDLIETHFATDVVLSPLGTDVDGLCAHTEDRAVIVASTSFDAGHVRFTLAHELGHHLLADPRPVIDEDEVEPASGTLTERRVSAFAAHLLLPPAGVGEMLDTRRVTQADFDTQASKAGRAARSLADRYGASVPATVYQLADLGFIADTDTWIDLLDNQKEWADSAVTSQRTIPSVRPPRRLLDAALDAAAARKTGTGPLAVLLDREDEDAIYTEFVAEGSLRA